VDHVLDSEVGEFEVENGRVAIRPIRRVAGKLSLYGNAALIQEESTAWRNAARICVMVFDANVVLCYFLVYVPTLFT